MSIDAMKQALEALEYVENNYMSLPAPAIKAIAALRLAIKRREDMTNEDIDRMLEQAVREAAPEELYKYPFARIVAAAEREACAKLCEEPGWNAANWCAKQIRARGEKP